MTSTLGRSKSMFEGFLLYAGREGPSRPVAIDAVSLRSIWVPSEAFDTVRACAAALGSKREERDGGLIANGLSSSSSILEVILALDIARDLGRASSLSINLESQLARE
jgi:hypothetical protein